MILDMNEPVDKYHYCLNTITVMYRQNIYPTVNPGQNPGQNLIELLSPSIVSMYERALLGHCNSVPGL